MSDIQWLGGIATVITALVAVAAAVLRLHNGIALQFDQTRRESEERAIVTHRRIDDLGATIDRTYLRKDLAAAHIQRLDAEIANIKGSIGCPATEKD